MKTETKKTELTEEISEAEMLQYEEIAAGLAVKHGVTKVHIFAGVVPETCERVIGYIKEPSYVQKLFTMNNAQTVGVFSSGEDLRQTLLIKEASHSLTYGEGSECDPYKLGVASRCTRIIQVSRDQSKKK